MNRQQSLLSRSGSLIVVVVLARLDAQAEPPAEVWGSADQEKEESAQARARATPAFKRAERAEEICVNYKKIDANNAQLTSKTEREIDRATGTSNIGLKRRVAAVNLNIEKLIVGLKNEYVRYGGSKADTRKGKQFWCSYRSVMDVYKEERARALAEANKVPPQPPAPTRSSQTSAVLWKSKSGPAPTAKEVCGFPEWSDLRKTLVNFCSHKNTSKKRQLICNGILIPAFSTCDAPVDFRDGRRPVMVGEDNAYCVPTNYENADELSHCVLVKFERADGSWKIGTLGIKFAPEGDELDVSAAACEASQPGPEIARTNCTIEGLNQKYLDEN